MPLTINKPRGSDFPEGLPRKRLQWSTFFRLPVGEGLKLAQPAARAASLSHPGAHRFPSFGPRSSAPPTLLCSPHRRCPLLRAIEVLGRASDSRL